MDYIYVNILNEGMIPWIKKKGPLFGYKLNAALIPILKRDSRIMIEFVKSEADIVNARDRYLKRTKPTSETPSTAEVVTPKDEIVVNVIKDEPKDRIIENNIKDDDIIDSELDNVLSNISETTTFKNPAIADKTDPEEPFKFYSDLELSNMTKSQMKKVLRGRGYLEGPYAGKYHDTVEMLKDKVRKTQTFKK